MKEISTDYEVSKQKKRELDDTEQIEQAIKELYEYEYQDEQEIESHNRKFIKDILVKGKEVEKFKDPEERKKAIKQYIDIILGARKQYKGENFVAHLFLEESAETKETCSNVPEKSIILKHNLFEDNKRRSDGEENGEDIKNIGDAEEPFGKVFDKKVKELADLKLKNQLNNEVSSSKSNKEKEIDDFFTELNQDSEIEQEEECWDMEKLDKEAGEALKEILKEDDVTLESNHHLKVIENSDLKDETSDSSDISSEAHAKEFDISENEENPFAQDQSPEEPGDLLSNDEENPFAQDLLPEEQGDPYVEITNDELPIVPDRILDATETPQPNEMNPESVAETFVQDLDEILTKFLDSTFIKQGYGILVPLEIIEKGGLAKTLKEFNLLSKKYLANPKLILVQDQLRKKLHLGVHKFSQLIRNDIQSGSINLQKFLHLSENPILLHKLTMGELKSLEEEIENILTSNQTNIYSQGAQFYFNFYPETLEKIKIGNLDYVILPTSKWETPQKRNEMKQWVLEYYKKFKKAPTYEHMTAQFGGFIDYEAKVYKRSYNQFLTECKIPINYEKIYDWTQSTTIKSVEEWIAKYNNSYGKSPTYEELGKEFPGFHNYLERERLTLTKFLNARGYLPTHKIVHDWKDSSIIKLIDAWIQDFVNIYGRSPYYKEVLKKYGGFGFYLSQEKLSYNKFLKSRGYSLNHEPIYNWKDPCTVELVKTWIQEYIKIHGQSPPFLDVRKSFGAFEMYLKRKKLIYNEFLEINGYPKREFKPPLDEGLIFDKLGKDCLEILFKNVRQFRVFHPIVKKYGYDYVIPDGIIHDFNKNPFPKKGSTISLEEGQKFDTIIEIKRSYTAISRKEREIYTAMAKKMKIYLLKDYTNLIQEKNGCQIIFYSKNELFYQLRSKITPSNQTKIVYLMKKIQALDKKLDPATMRELDDY